MITRLEWTGQRTGDSMIFAASVPGNIQLDYANAMGWGDINYGENCKKYPELEPYAWDYRTTFTAAPAPGERLFFVSGGIDYEYDVLLNDAVLYHGEGTFAPVELDLTDHLLSGENQLSVHIYPHPMLEGAPVSKKQAAHVAKPPVAYGWDWHPRAIPSGIWNDAYLETRPANRPVIGTPSYTLTDDLSAASVHMEVCNAARVTVRLIAPDGSIAYAGTQTDFTVEAPLLWWCNGEGPQHRYTWEVVADGYTECGKIGFRKTELRMNEGAWAQPASFPKTRSVPPITLYLNNRRVFAKGSNFVSPQIFPGISDYNTYEPLVRLAKECNMNIFRCWGGSGVQKDAFFELCDEMGIMIWQEFPLSCNAYPNDPHYLDVLEKEARSIIGRLRPHPCVILWCGGNELFNSWSHMTDQDLPLRLLNKVCYEEDPFTPFLPTSPVMGMGHGGYFFAEEDRPGHLLEVYEMFNTANCTAYTEFGVPSVPDADYLRTFIPEEELFPPQRGGTYETHHAFAAWHKTSWMCLDILEGYFGSMTSLEQLCECSALLQCEGYKAAFEEARRQSPYCAMAINWCYNEPWKTAANNSLLSYPARPKKAYYALQNSLRAVVPSARLSKYTWNGGEEFHAELWLLNDSPDAVSDVISAEIEIGGNVYPVLDWHTPVSEKNRNIKGHTLTFQLPEYAQADRLTLRLVSQKYGENSYTLVYRPLKKIEPVIDLTTN